MTQPLKIGVLLSGSGTNLQALIDDIAAGTLNAEIVQVVSSRPDAYGIERAQAAGIPVLVMNKTLYADAEAADAQIVEALQAAGAEYIVMAGYMRTTNLSLKRRHLPRIAFHPQTGHDARRRTKQAPVKCS